MIKQYMNPSHFGISMKFILYIIILNQNSTEGGVAPDGAKVIGVNFILSSA